MAEKLALFGGPKAATTDPQELIKWPLITKEDEDAVLEVLRSGNMSGTDLTKQFEKEFGEWLGIPYCLAHCNGTAALQAAMFGCEIGVGDEMLCPGMTYWASALQTFALGATPVFVDIHPDTLCIDPADIERWISPRTKAIMVVHYAGYPCDMDAILPIAEKHTLEVIEDVSHAHGTLYKGRKTGTFGHVAAMSCMSGKSLAASEMGMLATRDKYIYERAIAYGHYERHSDLTDPRLTPYAGYPMGGVKFRVNQLASALGRSQLRHYDARVAEIQKAMNYFWDLLEGAPGIKAHRPPKESGSTMGGWYAAKGLYRAEELGGLDIERFCEAVCAEGASTSPGANRPMHTHPVLTDCDIYGHGKPTRIANSRRDLRQAPESLPVTLNSYRLCYSIPWFKRYDKTIIEEQAAAFRKVAENARQLL
ncbi:MAG TPA: DegT/DnrJ/EryC1/StrS family aminotransferase [Candidatus Hydrogenedentes bacterium]|nr:DegT/DnrJ/EryC1/StrS family aminotransferase [Candidatus Hydrogenedentota bacterium]